VNAVDLAEGTHARLALLARAWDTSMSEAVDRLIDEFAGSDRALSPTGARLAGVAEHLSDEVEIYFEYRGHRIEGLFDSRNHAVEMVRGPAAGQRFRSPSAAAAAAVSGIDPSVSPNRNGWSTWRVKGTGEFLQSLRR
jgi:hypothetical protein